jgi:polyketide-type polyunsaturated fatty acid synthase PfaA
MTKHEPIAIVGLGAIFPGSKDAEGFWKSIVSGEDLMTEIPSTHWLPEDYYEPDLMKANRTDKIYTKRGAFLQDIDFDPMKFGVPPAFIKHMDTSQLLALNVADDALKDANVGDDKSRVSVILGVASGTEMLGDANARLERPIWVRKMRDIGMPEELVQKLSDDIWNNYTPWQENTFPGLLGNVVSGRIANRFDTGGTNCVVDAACAGSLAALSMAVNELLLHDADIVLTGGVDTLNNPFMFKCFSQVGALSKNGDCRPFSDQADGTMLGEGLGMFTLKRLSDAERDGDTVYAVLKSVGTSSDGRAKSIYAPVASGQARAIRRSYEKAGVTPDTIELVEAHGTGTIAGDAAEFEGLRSVYAEFEGKQWCTVGSVKSQIGHTKGAAGAAGLFKAVMALHQKVLPPTIGIKNPSPKLDLENSPFNLVSKSKPWIRNGEHPRRAAVSSFGFGGTNFHITLEEYVGKNQVAFQRVDPTELITLSGSTASEIESKLMALETAEDLRWEAYSSQQSFQVSAKYRLSLVGASIADLSKKIDVAKKHLKAKPEESISLDLGVFYGVGSKEGKTAFLFSGQGSQYVGMGQDLAINFSQVRETLDQADNMDFGVNTRLSQVIYPPSAFSKDVESDQAQTLTRTDWAQPAIGALSASILNLLKTSGVSAEVYAGHSYGEITALHAAGALSTENFYAASRKRGELMVQAPKGSMTAIMADVNEIRSKVGEYGLNVAVANHNSPTQTILSGSVEEIEKAEAKFKALNYRITRLPVSSAFHSPLMETPAKQYAEFLKGLDIGSLATPVYANATIAKYDNNPEAIRSTLVKQITSPVRWVDQIQAMYNDGVRTFIEVGPGNVLTSLVRKCLEGKEHAAINTNRKGAGTGAIWKAFGQMATAGVVVNYASLWEGQNAPVDPKSVSKPKFVIPLRGSNHDKPYPPKEHSTQPNQEPTNDFIESVGITNVTTTLGSDTQQVVIEDPYEDEDEIMKKNIEALAVAFKDIHQQTTEAHKSYLDSSEKSMARLLAAIGEDGDVVEAAPMQAPVVNTPAPVAAPVAAPVVEAAPAPAPVVEAAPQAGAVDQGLLDVMLAVVADKTGYPVDMLTMDMHMESDLGIDSIKRVEILSEVKNRVPGLPEFDANKMSGLNTLEEIVGYMSSVVGGSSASAAPVAEAAPVVEAAPTSAPVDTNFNGVDLVKVMLEVVADKTGYPVDMLTLDMHMESDLGIDSIKRVEILSEMKNQVPDLPEFDANKMSGLNTLEEITDYMAETAGGSASSEKKKSENSSVRL